MKKHNIYRLKDFLILWFTQSLSQLGSSLTGYALTLWLYEQTGSALSTAALTICSYAPYVLMSIFAGALTDRFDKKKLMLICDSFAAACTVTTLVLYRTGMLQVWHLYLLNILSGLMNTVQQPASSVAMTLIIPPEDYQTTSGLRSLSRSLISILNPLIATAIYSLAGLEAVIALDLGSFVIAFLALLLLIRIPQSATERKESVWQLARGGLEFLKRNPMILTLILFMSGINLISSAADAAMPGYVLPNPRGGAQVLGYVSSCAGIAMIFGSLLASVLPKPRNRVRVVYLTMLFSMATTNFVLAFARAPWLWYAGQILGWILVPVMDANLDVVMRTAVPVELQGRVYACRNTFQFFTIPIGLFLGGFLVDRVCEPFMAAHAGSAVLTALFGSGKGSGAAIVMGILAVTGTMHCLIWGRALRKYHYIEKTES